MKTMLFSMISWGTMGATLAVMFGMASVAGVLILFVAKRFEVKKDTRIDEIMKWLPKANCGGCGQSGCEAFANALIEGKAKLDECNPSSKEAKFEIANILGISHKNDNETMAVISCCGGDACDDKFAYQSYGTCVTQALLSGGRKACSAGCLGAGTCVRTCPAEAIRVIDGVAVVDKEKCISCGLCILDCPKRIIKRIPKSAKVYVACSTQSKGKAVMSVCKNGCITCGQCVRACPSDAIHLENNVAIIDYAKCTGCLNCVAKCPRKVIKTIAD